MKWRNLTLLLTVILGVVGCAEIGGVIDQAARDIGDVFAGNSKSSSTTPTTPSQTTEPAKPVESQKRQKSSAPSMQVTYSQYPKAVVVFVQQTLNEIGYHAGNVDGKYGPTTRKAVANFQKRENISRSGELNEKTLGKLEADEELVAMLTRKDAHPRVEDPPPVQTPIASEVEDQVPDDPKEDVVLPENAYHMLLSRQSFIVVM